MGTPAEKVDTKSSDEGSQKTGETTLTFDQKVNKILDTSEKDEKGNIILGDDVPDDLKYASRAEKRRRDTQSALARTTSANAVLQAENEGLVSLVRKGKSINISTEDQKELDEMKFSDPDGWRKKINELEQSSTDTLNTQLTENSEKAKLQGATGERKVLLDAFIHDNPDITITDDVLANDVPPRITNALEKGEISFIDFLGKVKEYLTTGKVVESAKPGKVPNLSDIGGNDTSGKTAEDKGAEAKYEDQMY